jgi:hypothetical protein
MLKEKIIKYTPFREAYSVPKKEEKDKEMKRITLSLLDLDNLSQMSPHKHMQTYLENLIIRQPLLASTKINFNFTP